MSGFRSRFPTVTPWTTDQDLSDIVFRPCFRSVVSEFAPAGRLAPQDAVRCGPGGARRPAASPLGERADRAPERWRGSTSRVATGHRHGGRAGPPKSWAHGESAHRGARTADDDPVRSPAGLPVTRRASSASRPGPRSRPPLISHIHPTGGDRTAGLPTLSRDRHPIPSRDRHPSPGGGGRRSAGLYPFRHVRVTVEPGG